MIGPAVFFSFGQMLPSTEGTETASRRKKSASVDGQLGVFWANRWPHTVHRCGRWPWCAVRMWRRLRFPGKVGYSLLH